MRKMRSTRGMTLVELMSAVVIVGVISAMAAPQMTKAYERMQFSTHHREVTSTLRLARSMAIAKKRPVGVHFAEDKRIVTLYLDREDLDLYNFGGADSVLRADTLPPQFVWMASDLVNDAIVYLPNGSAGFSGSGNVWTMAATSKTVAVQNTNVLAATGKVGSYAYYY